MNKLLSAIYKNSIGKELNIMEVCGTHTYEIMKSGMKDVIPSNINLISGPGCPVCVLTEETIDEAIYLAKLGCKIVTFGDLVKVKGSKGSLADALSTGLDIEVVYSVYDVIPISQKTNKEVVFLGVGFETTAPVLASIIKEVKFRSIKNLSFLLGLKRMEPILNKVVQLHPNLDGIICPGHVAVIVGANYFNFLTNYFSTVICGFQPKDILAGIYFITKHPKQFKNLYQTVVTNEGNKLALNLLEEVFEIKDDKWRNIGNVEDSSFQINNHFRELDARKRFPFRQKLNKINTTCSCEAIVLGLKKPRDCKLFGNHCNPNKPKGPCMVSNEGACKIHYLYGRENG